MIIRWQQKEVLESLRYRRVVHVTGAVRGGITFENCRSEGNDVDFTHFNKCDAGIRVVERDCNFAKRTVSKYVKPVGTVSLRFETLKPLTTANPSKPLSTGWMRSPFTFVQWLPKAGKYPIRFRVRQVGPPRTRGEGPGEGQAWNGSREFRHSC